MSTRREFVQSTLAALAALGIPESAWALQAGEELVRFTDYTDAFKIEAQAANPTVRCVDLRTLTSWTTPNADHWSCENSVDLEETARMVSLASHTILQISGSSRAEHCCGGINR